VVSKHEVCLTKEENGMLSYSLPVGVQVVWDDIIRSVNTCRNRVSNAIDDELPTEFDLQFYKAKALFLVQSEYRREEVLIIYKKLKAAFEEDPRRLLEIEKAKELLLCVLELEERECLEE